ncbi:MAG: DMT family transporter [Hyphomicrobiaceae bacterium]
MAVRSHADGRLRGAVAICLGALAFNGVDVIIKLLSGAYPLYEFLLVRAFATLPFVSLALLGRGGLRGLRPVRPGLVLLRSLLMFTGSVLFALGLATIALADAVSIYFILPMVVAGLAGLVLGERVPAYRWAAILAGFVGVLVIVRPGSGIFEWAALLIVACAVVEALGQVIARKLTGETTASVAFHQNAVALVGALAMALAFGGGGAHADLHPSLAFLVRPWQTPTAADLALMIAAGPITAAAMLLYVEGYKSAPASFSASFEYAGLIWATLLGWLFFADLPTPSVLAGAAIIVAAGLFMLHRDSRALRL